jgi:hypothetical protein
LPPALLLESGGEEVVRFYCRYIQEKIEKIMKKHSSGQFSFDFVLCPVIWNEAIRPALSGERTRKGMLTMTVEEAVTVFSSLGIFLSPSCSIFNTKEFIYLKDPLVFKLGNQSCKIVISLIRENCETHFSM